jgi:hypothetical protein
MSEGEMFILEWKERNYNPFPIREGELIVEYWKNQKFKSNKTNFDLIIQFFKNNDNKPSSSKEIQDATDLPRGNVAVILYATHKKYFQCVNMQKKRGRLWKLNSKLET